MWKLKIYKEFHSTKLQELLRTVQTLEEKLSDAEYKYSRLQLDQETEGVENSVSQFHCLFQG